MAEKKLNLDAPLLSTRRINKEAVSVRRNMATKLFTHDDSNTSQSSSSVPVLDQVPESASVPLEKAIDGNLTRLQSEVEDDDDDDVYSDAVDTLSLNHSISGNVEGMKPSEDSQPRDDFMLNRFLPAAKSMTVEQQQPQYALKRQPVPVMPQPMRQIRDIVPMRYEYNTTPSYYRDIEDEESDEDEDEDDEYLSKRGCGMSPQVCFRNSLGMLSSVHGQVKASKVSQLKSRFQSVKKLALDSIYKPKFGSRAQSPVHPSIGKKFNFGSEQVESNLTTASMPSSPYRQIGCLSPYRSVGNCSPLHHGGTRKEAEIMRANRLNKHIKNTSKSQDLLFPKSTRLDSSTSSAMEKTLYVDTQNFPKTSNVKILPETMETDILVGKKPKAILELKGLESLSISSGIKKMKAHELEKNNNGCDLSPPKKPSDSWLLRNLPLVSSKIPSRRYLFHPQRKDLEENSSVTKWETIVKTSCMHRDHIRYSEELVACSSCQSNT